MDTAKNMTALKAFALEVFPVIDSEEWVNWKVEEQLALQQLVDKLNTVSGKIRQGFDQTVWNGHDTGKVSTKVESIRSRIVSDKKPGRAAKSATDKVNELFA